MVGQYYYLVGWLFINTCIIGSTPLSTSYRIQDVLPNSDTQDFDLSDPNSGGEWSIHWKPFDHLSRDMETKEYITNIVKFWVSWNSCRIVYHISHDYFQSIIMVHTKIQSVDKSTDENHRSSRYGQINDQIHPSSQSHTSRLYVPFMKYFDQQWTKKIYCIRTKSIGQESRNIITKTSQKKRYHSLIKRTTDWFTPVRLQFRSPWTLKRYRSVEVTNWCL